MCRCSDLGKKGLCRQKSFPRKTKVAWHPKRSAPSSRRHGRGENPFESLPISLVNKRVLRNCFNVKKTTRRRNSRPPSCRWNQLIQIRLTGCCLRTGAASDLAVHTAEGPSHTRAV